MAMLALKFCEVAHIHGEGACSPGEKSLGYWLRKSTHRFKEDNYG